MNLSIVSLGCRQAQLRTNLTANVRTDVLVRSNRTNFFVTHHFRLWTTEQFFLLLIIFAYRLWYVIYIAGIAICDAQEI